MSPISFLRAGIQDPQYSHVLSFRRQVYFAPTDNFTVPDSVLIDFENISYRIFLSDKLTCYKCHQTGHVSSDCTSNHSYPQNTQKPQTEENFLSQIPSTSPEQNQITHENDESRKEMDAQVSTDTDK
uniref:Uncharacterized protein LOC114328966 n=1 Tax=Diabrotica virgifera virgifera TaxID=50390 RepID=A0A6P7FLB9_DIAVI